MQQQLGYPVWEMQPNQYHGTICSSEEFLGFEMSIVDDFVSRTPAFAPAKPALGRQISAAFIAFFRALGGGWRAAIDYRRLCQLSDGRLKERGLSRTDLPRELHQRHFANLRGYLDIIG